MKIAKTINLNFATIALLSNGIIKIKMQADFTIDLDECKAITNAIGVLSNNKQVPILMAATNTTAFTKECRDFSASDDGLKYTLADAMVVTNLAQQIFVSLYLKINKPSKPSKAFKNEEDAINWLLNFI